MSTILWGLARRPSPALLQALDELAREDALRRAAPAAACATTATACATAADTAAAAGAAAPTGLAIRELVKSSTRDKRGSGLHSAQDGVHSAQRSGCVAAARTARRVPSAQAGDYVGAVSREAAAQHASAPPRSLACAPPAADLPQETTGNSAVAGAAAPDRPRAARAGRGGGRAKVPQEPLAQGAAAGLWGQYVRAAWPAAHAAAEKRNRQRKHPLGPRPLCRQVWPRVSDGFAPCMHAWRACM